MNDARPRFTTEQRRELTRLGLLDKQIEALESTALRVGSAVLKVEDMLPARRAVSTEFAKVADTLRGAQKALLSLAAARDGDRDDAARLQVRGRVELASYALTDKIGEEAVFHKLLDQLAVACAILERARADAPKGPTRRKTAMPYPVALIHDALLHGFVVAHRDKAMPAFNIQVSAGLKSPFRRIVQLCYEAMQRNNDDPDRAIKGFMKWRNVERNDWKK